MEGENMPPKTTKPTALECIYDTLRDRSEEAGEYVSNRHLDLLAEAMLKAIQDGEIPGVTTARTSP
jgi:hypothetical protein